MGTLAQDLRFAVRMLRRQPGFTAAAVLTLALGIGANTALFSVVDAVLLRPLPYADSGRLVVAWSHATATDQPSTTSGPDFRAWRDGAASQLVHLTAAAQEPVALGGLGEARQVRALRVSAGFFELLGARAARGRVFAAGEVAEGAAPVVATHRFWQRELGGAPDAVGRELRLNGRSHTLVGVLPQDFAWADVVLSGAGPQEASALFLLPDAGGDVPKLWGIDPPGGDITRLREARYLRVLGRLAPGATLQGAQAQLNAVAARLAAAHPDTNTGVGVRLVPLRDHLVGPVRPVLLALLGAVVLVLAVAAVNVANLLLARGAGRQRELAVRAALGAGTGALVRLLLVESVLLALAGGAAGAGLAAWGVDALVALGPGRLPALQAAHVDARVLGFTFALSLFTGALAGLLPAVRAARPALGGVLRAHGAPGRGRLLGALVVAEVALALVLGVGAGLLARTLHTLQRVEPGFRPEGVLTLRLELPRTRYADEAAQRALFTRALERFAALPGVTAAGAVVTLPYGGDDISAPMAAAGAGVPAGERRSVGLQVASPGYFAALGIPLLRGRDFTAADGADAPGVVVLSEAAAQRWFPGEDPVGRRVELGTGGGAGHTVVGVVGSVRHAGPRGQPREEAYLALAQNSFGFLAFTLRTGSEAQARALVPAVRQAVAALDPELPVVDARTMTQWLEAGVAAERFVSLVAGLFGALAVLLAGVGVYGVLAYATRARTRELGVRLALGARGREVVRLVLARGLGLVAAGTLAGLVAAAVAGRALGALLHGVAPTDPLTFTAAALGLLTVGLAACALPAWRAARVDPAVALRAE